MKNMDTPLLIICCLAVVVVHFFAADRWKKTNREALAAAKTACDQRDRVTEEARKFAAEKP